MFGWVAFQLIISLIFGVLAVLMYRYGERELERQRRKMIELLHLPADYRDNPSSRRLRRFGVRAGALTLALFALMGILGLFMKSP